MKDRICHYKYNSTETEQIELHLVRTHISMVVSRRTVKVCTLSTGSPVRWSKPAKNSLVGLTGSPDMAILQ